MGRVMFVVALVKVIIDSMLSITAFYENFSKMGWLFLGYAVADAAATAML